MTCRTRVFATPTCRKNRCASCGLATTEIRSPAFSWNSPEGIMTSRSPRSTAQISTLARNFPMSFSAMPSSGEPAVTPVLRISTCPLAKVSILMAEGNRRTRAISVAQASSGLMAMLSPRSSLMRFSSSTYMGLRTRAMVCRAPSFLPMRQHSRFSSSAPVQAMTRSA